MRLTKVFAIAGLDFEAIGSKSLFSFCCRGDGILIGNKNVSSTIKKNQLRYRHDGMLISCHRKYRFVCVLNRFLILKKEADAVQKMEDSSQELSFTSAEVKRTDWLTCDKTMRRTELPQTTFRSSLQ